MKRYDTDVNGRLYEVSDGEVVPAEVAQALYDALRYVYEGQGAQDFTTLNSEEFDVMRKALALADGESE